MSSTKAAPVTASRTTRPGYSGIARIALAATMLAAGAQAAGAQTPTVTTTALQPAAWEFWVSSGALIPTGVQRNVLENAALTVAQVSYVVRPPLAIMGSFGWARSHDLASAGAPKVSKRVSFSGECPRLLAACADRQRAGGILVRVS